MKISVIVCTHNRSKDLEICLKSIISSDHTQLDEVVVVDNASDDDTRQLVQTYQQQFWKIKYVFEKKLGLPFARNAGWKESKSAVAFFIDDDCTVSENIFNEVASLFDQHWNGVDPFLLGTMVKPDFRDVEGYPDWLHDDYKSYLTQLNWGRDGFLGPREFLVGTSFAATRNTLEMIGGFNENLRCNYMDERWVEHLVRRQGGQIFYTEACVVYHLVSEDRLKPEWFYKRLHDEGEAYTRFMFLSENRNEIRNLLRFVYCFVKIVVYFSVIRIPTGKSKFDFACRLAYQLGRVKCIASHYLGNC
jgi:glycosyltransferase involved in cell wall biosynthesis